VSAVRSCVLRLLAMLGMLLALLAPARADTAMALTQTFNGAINFTGTQATIRSNPNSRDACSVYGSTTNRSATLTMPSGATVLSAQLYWAGSGNSADNSVILQGKTVTATRKYSSSTVGSGLNFFGGAADVTDIVKAKGSGSYTFSGLTVSTGSPWCGSQAVLGGFSLLVVYSHPSEEERILNLYEGFRYLQNSEYTVTATNFRWPSPWLPTREKARIGYISWEGDASLLSDGEALIFEGNELSDDMNPAGNQFNSKSSVNRDSNSYGIDFDVYDTEVVQWIFYAPTVTTTYRAGQDLVLLNAEILVVPTLPVSDLSIAMTRAAGALQVGGKATYTLQVTNNGPYTEAGPVTVVDTLPAGMSYVSASGTNWTCANSGQVVTCTYKASMAPNTNAAPLVLIANVNQAGSLTNTAQVTGTSDNNANNNTASDTATATAPTVSASGYRFTSKACEPNAIIDTQACPLYEGPMTGGASTPIYVTAVSGNKAIALSSTQETTVPMQFSLSCLDPAASAAAPAPVAATYAGTTLPVCLPNGATPSATTSSAWSSSVSMKFASGKASAAVNAANAAIPPQAVFGYADVGSVQLNLLAAGKTATTEPFVARPLRVELRNITNAAGGANPKVNNPDGTGFAKAGEDFNVEVVAYLNDGKTLAPSFGKEKAVPPLNFTHTTAAVTSAPMADAGELTWSGAARSGNAFSAKLNYSEVGAINLTPGLADYLGSGKVDGPSTVVGRFYPAYYTTTVTTPLACQAAMNCEAAPSPVNGAAYSGQTFDVEVKAFNAVGEGAPLMNFTGAWRKSVTLSAVAAKGGAAAVGGTLAAIATSPNPSDPTLLASPNYTLATPFDADKPASTAWTAPTAVYVRAESQEQVVGYATAQTVSSKRPPTIQSEEDGLMIVNGRLNVGSAQGTNTQRTPLSLQAQYWTGSAWINHSWVDETVPPLVGIAPGDAVYTSCRRSLNRTTSEPARDAQNVDNCRTGSTGIVKAGTAQAITLNNRGAGTFWLAAPGAANVGSVLVQMKTPSWLPSTRGRISFATTRTSTIYLRELYGVQ